jgi:uncharacterized protein (DUF2236 family)
MARRSRSAESDKQIAMRTKGKPEKLPRPLDYGFFGPDSPSWKIWTSPAALIGFQRAVVLEHFDPFLTAAVADHRDIYTDPRGRLDRTLAYFLTVAVADGRTAIQASEALMRMHARMTGIEPASGKRYNANSPDSQLWIHITGWHSVLKCYEVYGPGKLSTEEENRFWAEAAVAAELQTCKPGDIPRSREEVREYFASMRPKLSTSKRANEGMHHLLYTPSEKAGLRLWAMSRLTAPAAIATLPKWMRELGGYDQPGVLDRMVRLPGRVAVRATRGPKVSLAIVSSALPGTARILQQHLRKELPERAETITIARARELYGQQAVRRAGDVLANQAGTTS